MTPMRAGLLGFAIAALIILAGSRGDVDRMAYGDGLVYRYVASHLTTPPAEVDAIVVERGTSLRYGRIGLPALIWLASAGRPAAMPYTHPLLIAIAAGIACAASARLLAGAGMLGALAPFVAPGFAVSVAGGFGEVWAIALGLLACVAARERRWWMASAALAGAMLVRENSGAILLGLAVWCALGGYVSAIPRLALSLAPLFVWYAFVDARFGSIPFFDPYLRRTTDTLATPFVGPWHALVRSDWTSRITALVHFGLAAIGFARWKRSLLSVVAAAAGLQVIAAGAFAWHFVGDAARAFLPLQLFVIMSLVEARARHSATPRNTSA